VNQGEPRLGQVRLRLGATLQLVVQVDYVSASMKVKQEATRVWS